MLVVIPLIVYFTGFVTGLPYLIFLNGSTTLESVNSYINKFEPKDQVKALVKGSFSIGKLSGFTGDFSKALVRKLKECPFVSDVTPDIIVKSHNIVTQEDASRHLARISQRESLTGDEFLYTYNDDSSGQGVNAYVIDSGVRIDHPQFEGRARHGINLTPEDSNDFNGHGTHVAGLIGSKTYGVSKYVELVNVKALDRWGAGSLSMIIAAIEFAVKDMNETGKKGVANMSLGAAKNKALNRVVDAAVEAGLIIIVAAGNDNANACAISPASADKAITVGSIDDFDDKLAAFTNWGGCVDLFAPGKLVASVNIRSSDVPLVLSGTSMSSPQVAGLAANALSRGIESSDVKKYLLKTSTKNAIPIGSILFKFRTPNRIAYNAHEDEEDEVEEFYFEENYAIKENPWPEEHNEEKEFVPYKPAVIADI